MDKKIDVVYKLGSGSNFHNVELRYSLRSLSNFKDLGKVYIVGFRPNWIKLDEIVHIDAEDPYLSNKDGNLINKLILACTDQNLSEEFINISDDQLFMKSCGYGDIAIPMFDNKLKEFKPGERIGRWQERLQRTIDELKIKGYKTNCYETHIPCLLNKKQFPKTVFRYDYGAHKGLCGNTLYYNTINSISKEIEKDTLVRIVDPIKDRLSLETMCEGKMFLNYAERAINDNLLLYLQSKFSEKSKYENQ